MHYCLGFTAGLYRYSWGLLAIAVISAWTPAAKAAGVAHLSAHIIDIVPRSQYSFTQGLEIYNGQFYESSGLYGHSAIMAYPIAHDRQLTWHKKLSASVFAEGLSIYRDTLYVLSWHAQSVRLLNPTSGKLIGQYPYRGEGWGLTHNKRYLIRSDGSNILHLHSPDSFREVKTLAVTQAGKPVNNINELEYARGYIWANIWHAKRIVVIDPNSGHVVAEVNLTALVKREGATASESVLNGIAYNPKTDHFWLTGKHWHHFYQMSIAKLPQHSATDN